VEIASHFSLADFLFGCVVYGLANGTGTTLTTNIAEHEEYG
jgi:hypothetical protein